MNPLLLLYPLWLRQAVYFHSPYKNKSPSSDRDHKLEFAPVQLPHLHPTDHSHHQIAWLGFYELRLSRKIARLAVQPGGLLVDVGANIGYFSLIWAALNAQNRVFAFEPAPPVVNLLRSNVLHAALTSRIAVFPLALGQSRGNMNFDLGPEDESSWGGLTKKTTPRTLSVTVECLDDLLASEPVIDVLKIDAEGADSWVLRGAEALLRARRIRHIFFERNRPRMSQLGIEWSEPISFLQDRGYRVTPLSGSCDLDELHAEPSA